ncbi:MAG TPA: cupredoxin domain-containing protein [Candidatus Limnocylindrales bacterium]|nr:cupredoxin domain-containing protein [Candidatus Limnocylindrales bacterium]
MLESIWNGILEFTSKLVIPDWPGLIALLPVFVGFIVILFFVRVVLAYATAGPTRRGGGRRPPVAPPGVHMPGPTYAPVFAAIGTGLFFLGLVFGGLVLILGVTALIVTLLYWGRLGLQDYDHIAEEHPQVPAVVHAGPPPGVHMPGPSFRPFTAALAVAVLFGGLVFGGWVLGLGVAVTIVTLLGWLSDARKEYRHVVEADRTGHIENEPAPGWPKAVLWFTAIGLVLAIALDAGWFPPRSAPAAEAGGGPSPSASAPAPGQLALVAQNVKFDLAALTAPADTPFKISLDNRDVGTPHDVDITDAGGAKVFDGKDFPGPEVRVYDVPALSAGTYGFLCSIHPATMNGVLTVGG